eukprot:TRINITY_DN15527_c0_g1_i3.p2 TRINITY_DN15527_c0_g1~~TRINITY_DN15527_c0_g1_i3.p2  ORF type:complete len:172 (+),score=28.94 TRINITY_DN15527_c0_g1_i3:94-609(+)
MSMDQLEKLKSLLEEGFVTKDEYTQRRLQIVDKLTKTTTSKANRTAAAQGNVEDDTWEHDRFEGGGGVQSAAQKIKNRRAQLGGASFKGRGAIGKARAQPSVLNRLGLPTKQKKGNVDGMWKHDLFQQKGGDQGTRRVTVNRGALGRGRGRGRARGGARGAGRQMSAECPW